MSIKAYGLVAVALASVLLAGCSGAEKGSARDSEPVAEAIPERPVPGAMVLIPAGEFTMGSDEDPGTPALAAPARKVSLPAYHMDVYEVTNGQFMQFTLDSDYEVVGDWRASYALGREDYPVVNATWDDAKAFCKAVGKRLPTEAEWEYAARGPEGLRYPWGSEFNSSNANTFEHGLNNIVEVGSYETDKSPFGVYDVAGNVSEWTSELLKPYPGSKVDTTNLQGYVAVRGGSYALKGKSVSSYTRIGFLPKSQFGQGFRCAKDAEQ